MWKFVEPNWVVRDSPRTDWAACSMIYAINYALLCMRPEFRVHNVEPMLDD